MANDTQKKEKVWFAPSVYGLTDADVPEELRNAIDALESMADEVTKLANNYAKSIKAPAGTEVQVKVFPGFRQLGGYEIKMKIAKAEYRELPRLTVTR